MNNFDKNSNPYTQIYAYFDEPSSIQEGQHQLAYLRTQSASLQARIGKVKNQMLQTRDMLDEGGDVELRYEYAAIADQYSRLNSALRRTHRQLAALKLWIQDQLHAQHVERQQNQSSIVMQLLGMCRVLSGNRDDLSYELRYMKGDEPVFIAINRICDLIDVYDSGLPQDYRESA